MIASKSKDSSGRLEVLSELSSICGGGVFVSINNHPEFHQSAGNLMLTVTKVMEVCTNAGVVVTDNDLMWKQVSGLQLQLRRRLQALLRVAKEAKRS